MGTENMFVVRCKSCYKPNKYDFEAIYVLSKSTSLPPSLGVNKLHMPSDTNSQLRVCIDAVANQWRI